MNNNIENEFSLIFRDYKHSIGSGFGTFVTGLPENISKVIREMPYQNLCLALVKGEELPSETLDAICAFMGETEKPIIICDSDNWTNHLILLRDLANSWQVVKKTFFYFENLLPMPDDRVVCSFSSLESAIEWLSENMSIDESWFPSYETLAKLGKEGTEYTKILQDYKNSQFLRLLKEYGLTIVFNRTRKAVILKNNNNVEAHFSIFDNSWQDTPTDKTQLNSQVREFLTMLLQRGLQDGRDSLVVFADNYGYTDIENAAEPYIAASAFAWELRQVLPSGEFTNFINDLEYLPR